MCIYVLSRDNFAQGCSCMAIHYVLVVPKDVAGCSLRPYKPLCAGP
jgi:hypothetical protein